MLESDYINAINEFGANTRSTHRHALSVLGGRLLPAISTTSKPAVVIYDSLTPNEGLEGVYFDSQASNQGLLDVQVAVADNAFKFNLKLTNNKPLSLEW
jgi:hypothetical protein